MSLGTESLTNHDHIPKSSKFVRVKAFPMYSGIGEQYSSLIHECTLKLYELFISCYHCTTMSYILNYSITE